MSPRDTETQSGRSEEVVIPFGKYRGKSLGEIADADLLYLDWLNGLDNLKPRLMKAVADLCARRAREIDSMLED